MPLMVTTSWNGEIHVAIIHLGGISRMSAPLGAVLSQKTISDAEAAKGIDNLILLHFGEPGDAYHGA